MMLLGMGGILGGVASGFLVAQLGPAKPYCSHLEDVYWLVDYFS
ncbi:hypothetical protein [Spirosoma telluris]